MVFPENRLVSIIVTSYNYGKYIGQTIASVLNQTYPYLELIVCDDCSTDNSLEVIQSFHDPRITVLTSPGNQGASRCYQNALPLCKGSYLISLDSDDYMDVNRVEAQIGFMEAHPDIGICGTYIEEINSNGEPVQSAVSDWFNDETDLNDPVNWIWMNKLCHSSVMIRKSLHDRIGQVNLAMIYSPDYDFWLRCLADGACFFVLPEKLTYYRVHSHNITHRDPKRLFWEYSFISFKTVHPYLIKIGRFDLIDQNIKGFFNHPELLNGSEPDKVKLFDIFLGKERTGFDWEHIRNHEVENEFAPFFSYLYQCWIDENKRLIKTRNDLENANVALTESQKDIGRLNGDLERTHTALMESQISVDRLNRELNAILTSQAYQLSIQFRKIKNDIWNLVLSPFRMVRPFFSRMKRIVKGVFWNVYQLYNASTTQKISVNNLKWPSGLPLLSIIIPCYNYGKYVEEAIDSVLEQTFQRFEIIVVDGGSEDESTIEKLSSLCKPKTDVYFRKGCHLVGDNRNFGISLAQGRYICCLDADDKLKPTYLEKALFYLEKYNFDLVHPSVQCFEKDDLVWMAQDTDFFKNCQSNCIATVAVYKKSIWEKVGGYRDWGLGRDHVPEDWDFWTRILGHGFRTKAIGEPLMLYRVHGNGLTAGNKKSVEEQRRIIKNENKSLGFRYRVNSVVKRKITFNVIDPFINMSDRHKNKAIMFALPFMIIGGADKVLIQIGQLLKNNNYNVSVITTQESDHQYGDNSTHYQKFTSRIYHFCEFLKTDDEKKDFLFYLIESQNINLIFIVGCEFLYHLLPEIKARYPHVKIVDQLYNEYGHVSNNRKYSDYIDLNIVENGRLQKNLLNKYHYDPDSLKLIRNGVSTHEYKPNHNGECHIFSQYQIPMNKFTIVFFGRFSEEKGPDVFVEIAKMLVRDSYDEYYFIMGGNGPVFNEVHQLISKYGLNNHILTPGIVDVKSFLEIANLTVVPSRIDGRPNIVLESLAMGVPVLASNTGGLPEIIVNGYNGFLCDIENLADFVRVVQRLKNDSRLYQKLQVNSRKYAVENLDSRKMLNEYLTTFDGLLSPNFESNSYRTQCKSTNC